jgi:hypothetical protein
VIHEDEEMCQGDGRGREWREEKRRGGKGGKASPLGIESE